MNFCVLKNMLQHGFKFSGLTQKTSLQKNANEKTLRNSFCRTPPNQTAAFAAACKERAERMHHKNVNFQTRPIKSKQM
jgi:hypothetical protein